MSDRTLKTMARLKRQAMLFAFLASFATMSPLAFAADPVKQNLDFLVSAIQSNMNQARDEPVNVKGADSQGKPLIFEFSGGTNPIVKFTFNVNLRERDGAFTGGYRDFQFTCTDNGAKGVADSCGVQTEAGVKNSAQLGIPLQDLQGMYGQAVAELLWLVRKSSKQ